jgi:hypothetical protein
MLRGPLPCSPPTRRKSMPCSHATPAVTRPALLLVLGQVTAETGRHSRIFESKSMTKRRKQQTCGRNPKPLPRGGRTARQPQQLLLLVAGRVVGLSGPTLRPGSREPLGGPGRADSAPSRPWPCHERVRCGLAWRRPARAGTGGARAATAPGCAGTPGRSGLGSHVLVDLLRPQRINGQGRRLQRGSSQCVPVRLRQVGVVAARGNDGCAADRACCRAADGSEPPR